MKQIYGRPGVRLCQNVQDAESRGDRDATYRCTEAARGAGARQDTTNYRRSTTERSSGASAGGNDNAKATPHAMPRRSSGHNPISLETKVRRRRMPFAGFVARTRGERPSGEEGDVWGDGRG